MDKLRTLIFLAVCCIFNLSNDAFGQTYSELVEKGDALQAQEKFEDAITLFQQARELCKKGNKEESRDMLYILASLGSCHEVLGNWEEAEPLYFQALELGEKCGYHPEITEETLCFPIAIHYIDVFSPDLQKGEKYLERAEAARQRDGDTPFSQYLTPLRHKLNYLKTSFEPNREKAVEILQKEYDYFVKECPLPREEVVLNIYECGFMLACGYEELRHNEKCLETLNEVEKLVGSQLTDEILLNDLYSKKIYALNNLGRDEECLRFGESLLKYFPEAEWNATSIAGIKYNMARSYNAMEQYDKALDLINSIYESPFYNKVQVEDDCFVQSVKAYALNGLGRKEEAWQLCQDLLNKPHDPELMFDLIIATYEIMDADNFSKLGFIDDFVRLYETTGIEDPQFAGVFLHVAMQYGESYLKEQALDMVDKAIKLYEKLGETSNPDYFVALGLKGALLGRLGRVEEIGPLYTTIMDRQALMGEIVKADIEKGSYEDSAYMIGNLLEMLYNWFSTGVYYLRQAELENQATPEQMAAAKQQMKAYQQQILSFSDDLNDEFKDWLRRNDPNWLGKAYFLSGLSYRDLDEYAEQIAYLDSKLKELPQDCEMYEILLEQRDYARLHTEDLSEMTGFIETKYANNIAELKKMLNALTADQRIEMWNEYFGNINNFTAYAVAGGDVARLNQLAYDAVLVSKGLLLQSDIDFETRILRSGDQEVLKMFDDWKKLKATDADAAASLERELIRKVGTSFESDAFKTDWKQVRDALGTDEYALEFTTVDNYGQKKYYGLLLGAGFEYPRLIEICGSEQLTSLGNGDDFDFGNLSRIVWKPLEDHIPAGASVYFVPDFQLHSYPLENLPDFVQPASLISDRWKLRRLSSTRQVARRNEKKDRNFHVEMYGGLDYTVDRDALLKDYNENLPALRSYGGEGDEYLRGSITTIRELPGSKREIEEIEKILKDNSLSMVKNDRMSGTEARFKATAGKEGNILHISTHGFFINPSQFDSSRIGKLLSLGTASGYDDALRSSGLMMSGVNEVLTGRVKPSECEDGLLTAKEISLLNLSDVDFAVLSACETGVGAVSGDGVFGLQRGFKLAGVNSLMMSLWKVDDDATEMLMTEFYKNWVKEGDAQNALLKAQEAVRSVPGWEAPLYWASFVLLDSF